MALALGALLLTSVAPYVANLSAALQDNLAACWSLEEASGTRDDAHSTNDLTDNNTVTSATGQVGTAASFASASSEYLSRADNAALSITGDFTIAGWAYFNDTGTFRDFASKWNSADNNNSYLLRRSNGDQIQFYVSSNGIEAVPVTNTTAISATTWYFIAARHDATNDVIRLRVTTTDATPVAHTTNILDGTAAFFLGAIEPSSPANFLDGRLDEWAVWGRHLSDAELTTVYNSGTGMDCSTIIAGGGGGGGSKPKSGLLLGVQ